MMTSVLISELESKWYKFDFEHVLPRRLLPSRDDVHSKVAYQCSGLIIQARTGFQIQSFNTPFIISDVIDASLIPRNLLQPLTMYTAQHFNPNCAADNESDRQSTKTSNNHITDGANQCQKYGSRKSDECGGAGVDADVHSIASDDCTDGACPVSHNLADGSCPVSHNLADGSCPVSHNVADGACPMSHNLTDGACPPNHSIVCTLWLSQRLLEPGRCVDIQLNIDNCTDASFQARLLLFQVYKRGIEMSMVQLLNNKSSIDYYSD